jgi:hypothetical protein
VPVRQPATSAREIVDVSDRFAKAAIFAQDRELPEFQKAITAQS